MSTSLSNLVIGHAYKIHDNDSKEWLKMTFNAAIGMHTMGHTAVESDATKFYLELGSAAGSWKTLLHPSTLTRIYFMNDGSNTKQYITCFRDIKDVTLYSLGESQEKQFYGQPLGLNKGSHAAHFNILPTAHDAIDAKQDTTHVLQTGDDHHLLTIHHGRGLLGRAVGMARGEISEVRNQLTRYRFHRA